MAHVPQWLDILAWLWISICLVSGLWITLQTLRTPQKMWIMNIVWPITGLYMGPVALYMYRRSLPVSSAGPTSSQRKSLQEQHKNDPPTLFQNCIAVFHCGAGCSLGDVLAESAAPALALTFAGKFGSKLLLDFACAYILGIVFQYFTIVPMRGLSFRQGLWAAIRADTVSIGLFEVGMFTWMAIAYYGLFPSPHLHPEMAVFWFMMQIAMVAGFFTALPANAWLIRKGWKEKMPQLDPNQMQEVQPSDHSPRKDQFAA